MLMTKRSGVYCTRCGNCGSVFNQASDIWTAGKLLNARVSTLLMARKTFAIQLSYDEGELT